MLLLCASDVVNTVCKFKAAVGSSMWGDLLSKKLFFSPYPGDLTAELSAILSSTKDSVILEYMTFKNDDSCLTSALTPHLHVLLDNQLIQLLHMAYLTKGSSKPLVVECDTLTEKQQSNLVRAIYLLLTFLNRDVVVHESINIFTEDVEPFYDGTISIKHIPGVTVIVPPHLSSPTIYGRMRLDVVPWRHVVRYTNIRFT